MRHAAGDPKFLQSCPFQVDISVIADAVETARRKIEEIEALLTFADTERDVALAGLAEAQANLRQARDELDRTEALIANAFALRIQAILLPIRALGFAVCGVKAAVDTSQT